MNMFAIKFLLITKIASETKVCVVLAETKEEAEQTFLEQIPKLYLYHKGWTYKLLETRKIPADTHIISIDEDGIRALGNGLMFW